MVIHLIVTYYNLAKIPRWLTDGSNKLDMSVITALLANKCVA